MRLRLALTLDIERRRELPAPAEVVEHQGAQVEMSPQPRLIGFVPEE